MTGTIARLTLAATIFFAVLAVAPARAADISVKIANFTFDPPQITVKTGTTVVSAGKFRSKTMDTDNAFSFTFTAAGDYKYFCSLHPHMTGMITVE